MDSVDNGWMDGYYLKVYRVCKYRYTDYFTNDEIHV